MALHVLSKRAETMHKLTLINRTGLCLVTLLMSSAAAQTDPNRAPDVTATTRTDVQDNDGMDLGWLGLIGLAGLAGLKRKAPQPVVRTDDSHARVYPAKS